MLELVPGPPDRAPGLIPRPPQVSEADLALCREITARASRSFYLASLLLPRRVRQRAHALYAFCRATDDAVDDDPTAGYGRIAALRRGLDRVWAGQPEGGVERAFGALCAEAAIPRSLPEALIDGMAMDVADHRYRTWEDLGLYAFRVAAVVGLMMTAAMGVAAPPALRRAVLLRACDLGVGMQLTNIARDVGEDARRGRVYLPDALLRAHGTTRDAILAAAAAGEPADDALRGAVRELLVRADDFYLAGARGIPHLPWRCRWAIRAALHIYRAIGPRIAARGYDSLTGRAYVPAHRRIALALRALLPGPAASAALPGPEDAHLGALVDELGLGPRFGAG